VGALYLYPIGDEFLERERNIEELLIVNVLLLSFEVEDVQMINVLELQSVRTPHRIYY
jgi:hypothetical protein